MEAKMRILNGQLAKLIVSLAHGEMLVIADAGLPIPPSAERIDLSLMPGIPSFLDVLKAVAGSCAIESAAIAKEMETSNPNLFREIAKVLPNGLSAQQVSHQALKEQIQKARAVVRTGECTPYANIALIGAAPFFVPDVL